MISALMVAIVAISAVWVYLDATKNRIGKIPGLKSMFNMSAGAWGTVTLGLWFIAFPAYLLKRKSLTEYAKVNPINVGGRGIKVAILGAFGVVWFLAAAANALTIQSNAMKSSNEGYKQGWLDKATSVLSPNGWEFHKSNSGIDGEKFTATRVYLFESRNTQFDIEISCQPGKKLTLGDLTAGSLGGPLSMTIKSFVGDVSQPTEVSALVSEAKSVPLNHYSNPVALQYPVARVKIGENVYSGALVSMVFRMGDYSNEAVSTGLLPLGESIPMAIELKNGAGVFELAIDRSFEVERVLAACGQDEKSISLAKAEEAREAQLAKQEADAKRELADQRASCLKDGRGISGNGDQVDCATAFPDEFAEFQQRIQNNALMQRKACAEFGQSTEATGGTINCATEYPDEFSLYQQHAAEYREEQREACLEYGSGTVDCNVEFPDEIADFKQKASSFLSLHPDCSEAELYGQITTYSGLSRALESMKSAPPPCLQIEFFRKRDPLLKAQY